jgi:DNA-binding MarR family transcriptional regulator
MLAVTKGVRAASRKTLTVTLPELLVEGSDHEFRELIALLYASIGQLQSMRRQLADSLGVSTTELSILLGLHHLSTSGRVRIRQIADHLCIAAPNVTAAISSLEQQGWVGKSTDPSDARAVSIVLTPGASVRLDAFAERCARLNDCWFRGLTRKDMLVVTGFFRRLDQHYDAAHGIGHGMMRKLPGG